MSWIERDRQLAWQGLPCNRIKLQIADRVIGSVHESIAQRLRSEFRNDFASASDCLSLRELAPNELDNLLERMAQWLDQQALAGHWRNELIRVISTGGRSEGKIERAAARVLGLQTSSVQLIGFSSDDQVWLQQRAWDKPTDPGKFDTLMGGLLSAADSVQTGMWRELREEAGLGHEDLERLHQSSTIDICRPVDSGRDQHSHGVILEQMYVFQAWLKPGRIPVNQDGEVAGFHLKTLAQTIAMAQAQELTLDARLALADYLQKQTR